MAPKAPLSAEKIGVRDLMMDPCVQGGLYRAEAEFSIE
jgi:hypothetical protein